jgi:uncharacterized membrane protein YgdD (TMEM256/DUF423 family)
MNKHKQAGTVLQWAAIFGALAVGLGAFGAHGLAGRLDELGRTDTYETAVSYHFYHSLALLLLGGIMSIYTSIKAFKISALLFVSGIVIFSGSLYVLSLTGMNWLGAITPFGGVAFILGWVSLLVGAIQIKNGK